MDYDFKKYILINTKKYLKFKTADKYRELICCFDVFKK